MCVTALPFPTRPSYRMNRPARAHSRRVWPARLMGVLRHPSRRTKVRLHGLSVTRVRVAPLHAQPLVFPTLVSQQGVSNIPQLVLCLWVALTPSNMPGPWLGLSVRNVWIILAHALCTTALWCARRRITRGVRLAMVSLFPPQRRYSRRMSALSPPYACPLPGYTSYEGLSQPASLRWALLRDGAWLRSARPVTALEARSGPRL